MDWQHAVYGYRAVDCVPASDAVEELQRVRVRDFNPYAVKRCAGDTTWQDAWNRRIVVEPSIMPTWGAFQCDVESRLPYTEVMSEETFDVNNVMLDDRRILLLKVVSNLPWSILPGNAHSYVAEQGLPGSIEVLTI